MQAEQLSGEIKNKNLAKVTSDFVAKFDRPTADKKVTVQQVVEAGALSDQAAAAVAVRKSGYTPEKTIAVPRPDGVVSEAPVFSECVADRYGYRIDDKTYIDFLALKKMLHNLVNEQDNALTRDGPPMTLTSLTLTSTFQMALEAQAGLNIFHILPILSAPNGQFKADHTHKLKIQLNGVKRKGDPEYSKKLVRSCQNRVQRQLRDASVLAKPIAGGNPPIPADQRCDSLTGIMLEAVIETLETGGGSAGAGN